MKTKLAVVRKRQRKTQKEVAHQAGISVRYLRYLEAGQKQPTAPVLFRLAQALNTTVEEIFACMEQKAA